MELLSLNPGMFIWTMLTFVVVVIVLKKVAWKPILQAVENREKTISDSLAAAEQARNDAERILAEHQEKLASAQKELQQMLKEGKDTAEKIRNEIIEQARTDAEKIKIRATSDIDKERQVMVAALRQEVADVVVQATAKLLGTAVDKGKHQQLIDDSVSGFGTKN